MPDRDHRRDVEGRAGGSPQSPESSRSPTPTDHDPRTDDNEDLVAGPADDSCGADEMQTVCQHAPFGAGLDDTNVVQPADVKIRMPRTAETSSAPPMDDGDTTVVTGAGDEGVAKTNKHFQPTETTDDIAGLAQQVFPAHEHVGNATIGSSIFNLASSAVGAGSLTFPYAFAKLGLVPGLFVLMLSGGMCVYTVDVLIRLVEILKAPTYEKLGEVTFGKAGRLTVGVTIFAMSAGLASVYCVLVGQFLSPVLELASENSSYPEGVWGTRLAVFCVWLVCMLPWCLLKNIDSLKYISAFAVLAILVTVVALVVHAAQHVTPEEAQDRSRAFAPASIEVIQAVTNIKVGFTGQIVSFAVYNEMGGRSVGTMFKASTIAISLCGVIYTALGVSGVIAVGLDAPENVLEAFDDPLSFWYVIAAYIAMLVVVVVSFPIVMFPARDAALAIMGWETSYDTPDRTRMLVSTVIAVVALLIGLFVPSLSLLFGVVGGICGNLISNVLPAVFALKTGQWTVERVGKLQRVLIFLPLVYGVIVGPLGLAVSIYLTFRSEDDDDSGADSPAVTAPAIVNATATAAAAFLGVAPPLQ